MAMALWLWQPLAMEGHNRQISTSPGIHKPMAGNRHIGKDIQFYRQVEFAQSVKPAGNGWTVLGDAVVVSDGRGWLAVLQVLVLCECIMC